MMPYSFHIFNNACFKIFKGEKCDMIGLVRPAVFISIAPAVFVDSGGIQAFGE